MSATAERMTTAEVLKAALERLGPNGERWHKGSSYADEFGVDVAPWIHEAFKSSKCCASAAIIDNENPGYRDHRISPAWELFCTANGITHIPEWNDAPERTWSEVKAAFLRAIELAEASR